MRYYASLSYSMSPPFHALSKKVDERVEQGSIIIMSNIHRNSGI